MKKAMQFLFSRILGGSPTKKALGTSLGLLIGILPFGHYAWILAIGISCLFSLNIITLLLGMSLSFGFPIIQYILCHSIKSSSPFYAWMGKPWLFPLLMGLLISSLTYPLLLSFYRLSKQEHTNSQKKMIFHRNQRHWLHGKKYIKLASFSLLMILFFFGVSIYINPVVPSLYSDKPIKPEVTPISQKLPERFLDSKTEYMHYDPAVTPTKKSTASPHKKLTRYGFYVPWDQNAWRELQYLDYITNIDVLLPEWYSINSNFTLSTNAEPQHQQSIDSLSRSENVGIMPIVNNVKDDGWDSKLVHELISSSPRTETFIQKLLQTITTNHYIGINIDFEAINSQDKQQLTQFMTKLYRAFHKKGLQVTMDVPAEDGAFDYKALSKVTDQLFLMLYDKHFPGGEPGPIAPLGWIKHLIDTTPVEKTKTTYCLGTYGYDWNLQSKRPAKAISFDALMRLINQNHLQVQWDSISKNPYVRYKKGKEEHIVWFLDGTTFYNELKLLNEANVHGVAIWRIGAEDNSIWKLLADPTQVQEKGNQLTSFHPELPIYDENGEILHITSKLKSGKRKITMTPNHWISNVSYTSYSNPYEVERIPPTKPKQVALSFDDGPDAKYTPQILDILDKYKVKASFYIVGENAVQNQGLIRRIFRSGHDIGSHTYTHPSVATISPLRTKLELNINQRLFQSITGHTMTTFRPPFQADTELPINEDFEPIQAAQNYGYTMIAEKIDTLDWQRPPSSVIVERVKEGMGNGNIILLHDAGGNRSHTVKALPHIIEYLKQNGYQLVTVSQMMGKNRNQTLPPISAQEIPFMKMDRFVFKLIDILGHCFAVILYLAIGLGFIRVLFLMFFALRQHRKLRAQEHQKAKLTAYNPMVSVVIAAYNEEKVIKKTIESVLQSTYDPLEIIIVNDGSTDKTEKVLQETYGDHPSICIIMQQNEGKTSAINRGYRMAKGEIIVSIDADTIIAKDAISLLVRHFQDEKVAAVSGNVKVGNVRNLLTLWQHIEYITGFNLERRAFDELNCIPVVPGAIGAWRKGIIEEVGYFEDDTLAEDTDITITLLEKGYRIEFEDKAFAYTESPEDVKSLLKQRTRWIFGTLQCLWKHQGSLFSKKQKSLGYISLPNMWVFQYGVQMFSPFIDILCIISLFTAQATKILVFYIIFLLFDLVAAFFAFSLEKENPKPLIWLFIQRFAYRQFMSYVVIKSLSYAIRGLSVSWNKVTRKGNIQLKTHVQ